MEGIKMTKKEVLDNLNRLIKRARYLDKGKLYFGDEVKTLQLAKKAVEKCDERIL